MVVIITVLWCDYCGYYLCRGVVAVLIPVSLCCCCGNYLHDIVVVVVLLAVL